MKSRQTERAALLLQDFANQALDPFNPLHWIRPLRACTAVLCWGKAAHATAHALSYANPENGVKIPSWMISPVGAGLTHLPKSRLAWGRSRGEHPLPGKESFAASRSLLEFFDSLRREKIRHLDIYLSGGASSLAWLPPSYLTQREFDKRLRALYAWPLPIAHLNQERSKLCQLKAGGAARWLKKLAPQVSARVWVMSDVLPYGPEVVGSGPFWDGIIQHRVVADNSRWVANLKKQARVMGMPVISASSGTLGLWSRWVDQLEAEITQALDLGKTGLLIRGGEPQVDLRRGAGAGGRQTQIAVALLARFGPRIAVGEIEILCLSSDGRDGTSESAGAHLTAVVARRARKLGAGEFQRALSTLNTAPLLRKLGALIPAHASGVNVQDVILVRV